MYVASAAALHGLLFPVAPLTPCARSTGNLFLFVAHTTLPRRRPSHTLWLCLDAPAISLPRAFSGSHSAVAACGCHVARTADPVLLTWGQNTAHLFVGLRSWSFLAQLSVVSDCPSLQCFATKGKGKVGVGLSLATEDPGGLWPMPGLSMRQAQAGPGRAQA